MAEAVERSSKVAVSKATSLTTGTADWQMPRAHGKHSAGKAPTCKENEVLGWIKASEGSWLGSSNDDWPPGSTDFTLTFDVTSPDVAHFKLQYAADNKLESATLNGKAISVPSADSASYKSLSTLTAEAGKKLFRKGANTLSIQVSNSGRSDNPMGFYARGSVVEAAAGDDRWEETLQEAQHQEELKDTWKGTVDDAKKEAREEARRDPAPVAPRPNHQPRPQPQP